MLNKWSISFELKKSIALLIAKGFLKIKLIPTFKDNYFIWKEMSPEDNILFFHEK